MKIRRIVPGTVPEGQPMPEVLIGAKIVDIGMPDSGTFEGGGLAIDFIAEGSTVVQRIIFEFTELGMWISERGVRVEGQSMDPRS